MPINMDYMTDEVRRAYKEGQGDERERCLRWVRSVLNGPGDHFTIDPVIWWLEEGIESGKEPPKEEP